MDNNNNKQWRKDAFAALETLIEKKLAEKKIEVGSHYRKSFARGWAYKWLSDKLGVHRRDCRISTFDINTCRYIIDLCSREVL